MTHEESKSKGMRYNDNKPKLSYCMDAPHACAGKARVKEAGAKKYARNNWKKGLPFTEICDSLLRHLTLFLDGQDIDKESGLPHVDHIHTNAEFLAELYVTRPECDDRSDVEVDNKEPSEDTTERSKSCLEGRDTSWWRDPLFYDKINYYYDKVTFYEDTPTTTGVWKDRTDEEDVS